MLCIWSDPPLFSYLPLINHWRPIDRIVLVILYFGYAAWLLSPSFSALKPSPQTVDPDQDRCGQDPGEPSTKTNNSSSQSMEKWNWNRSKRNWEILISGQNRSVFIHLHSLCFHHLKLQSKYQKPSSIINILPRPIVWILVVLNNHPLLAFYLWCQFMPNSFITSWVSSENSRRKPPTPYCNSLNGKFLFVMQFYQKFEKYQNTSWYMNFEFSGENLGISKIE